MQCRLTKSTDVKTEDFDSLARSPRAYGDQAAEYFRPAQCWSLVIGSDAKPHIAVTRLISKTGLQERTASIPPERAFIIDLHLTPAGEEGCEIWLDQRYSRITEWPAGAIGIYDLERNPRARNRGPVDWVHYYVPRSALDAFTDDVGIDSIETLQCLPGTFDPVLQEMTHMILPTPRTCPAFSKLFLDYFRLLFCVHLAERYAPYPPTITKYRGGLAPWQKRRATELLREHLDGALSLATLAHQCGLSVSHFARSFKRSFGVSAHHYLILQRVERAKVLLSNSVSPLSEVALEAGFSDQASFSRTFKAIVGTSPLQWRREINHRGLVFTYSHSDPAFSAA
jgi:AraC family transcriptional regulator